MKSVDVVIVGAGFAGLYALHALRGRGFSAQVFDADAEAQEAWVRHVAEVGNTTLYPQAQSWYMGSNIPGKTRVFLPYVGGVGPYRRKCDEVAAADYAGFTFSA